jgi:Tol biopolymer transport system component
MPIVRVFAAAIKPILIGGAVTATAAGGVAAWQYTHHDDRTPFQRVQAAGTRLIVSEFDIDADTIVAIDPDDPSDRTEIARVDHAPEWGAFASLAPDGAAIAYTALPSDAEDPSPDTPAIAGIVEDDGDVRQLASDVDLLITPVWSPDASSIVVRKNTPVEDSAGRFDLILLSRDGSRSTITSWTSAAVFPIAFSPDGAKLYFATLGTAGSDLYSVSPDGSDETLIAHLGDKFTRDWRLSPDGTSLAYTALSDAAPATMRIDLGTAEIAPASPSEDAQYNPIWSPAGDLTVAGVSGRRATTLALYASGGSRGIVTNQGAIDLPMAWSPDGATLAVRTVNGTSPLDAGASHLALVSASDGARMRISDSPDVTIVGWLE